MSEPKHNLTPYRSLGFRLRKLRETSHQTIAEVSGAVEIDPDNLARIENGEHRPSEDVLLLLISHFDPKEDEAVQLWEMAGYDQNQALPGAEEAGKSIIMMVQPDNRIIYSDMVNIVASPQGVVMNFLQAQGSNQANAISRVGMSREQALRVFEALGYSLQSNSASPKILPPPKTTSND